ncbi:unnamed protein product [Urochloa decumbens]|uniref:F-box domain-containing protein n=1 Tax=Urochloa decumbens TaxID=240449 RepID=A0ABC9FLK9_9POAL
MAPPRRPPELMAELVEEVLLRLPPDDPSCLVHASLVCKPWRRLLSDPGFPSRYRQFHQTPPLLGFIRNTYTIVSDSEVSCFVPTTAAPPFSPLPLDEWDRGWVLDCRHGRVLLDWRDWDTGLIRLAVWAPIAGDVKVLPRLPYCIPSLCCKAAVLCSMRGGGCDHLDCHGGAFRVVLLGSDLQGSKACVYSSEAGAWTAPASIHFQETTYTDCWFRPTLVGDDDLYFRINICGIIVKYDLGKHCVSVLEDPPFRCHYNSVLMVTEDVLLGAAIIEGSSLRLWSREVKPKGAAVWIQRRVIELDTLIPSADSHSFNRQPATRFAEGLGTIFVSIDTGLFSIDVKSWRVKKVGEPTDCYKCIPFMSFYTPDFATRRLSKRRRVINPSR